MSGGGLRPTDRPTAHGSARLVAPGQAGLSRLGGRHPGIALPLGLGPGFLGRYYGLPAWPAGQNLLVLGPPRSGKGTTFYVPTLLGLPQLPEPRPTVVVSDPKGELLALARPRLETAGYCVHVVAFSDPAMSNAWNPLSWLDDGGEDVDYAAAQALAQAMVPQHPQESQPFFTNAARVIIGTAAVLAYRLAPLRRHEPGTLSDVFALAYALAENPVTIAQVAATVDSWAGQQLSVLAKSLGNDQRLAGNVFADLPVRYQSWTTPAMLGLLSEPNAWTWRDVLNDDRQPHAVFVLADPTQSAQLAVFWSSLFAAGVKLQRRRGRLVRPVWLALDEFGNVGRIGNILTAMTVLPGAGVSTTLGLQSIHQPETVYPAGEAKTILSSVHAVFALPGLDPDSTKWVTQHLGVGTTRTHRRTTARDGSVSWVPEQHQRQVLEPDEVASLPSDRILVQRMGYSGTLLRARPYHQVREWREEAQAGNPASTQLAERLESMRHPVPTPPDLRNLSEQLLRGRDGPTVDRTLNPDHTVSPGLPKSTIARLSDLLRDE